MTNLPTSAAPGPDDDRPLLEVRGLAVSFDRSAGPPSVAVDGVSFTVFPRQTVALVGESGCGKSVTAMSALQLLASPPARITGGAMHFHGEDGRVDLLSLSGRDIRRIRGRQIAMIFQEPMTSLNPVFTIGEQIIEAILLHQRVSEQEAVRMAEAALSDVGISDGPRRLQAYPHQFSGGMRQRVMIAMALACRPRLLIADEPTTALDVTIQAQILELLRELQRTRAMGMLLITHALGVVAENADVVCVMYGGRVVEYAGVTELFERPLHPYTRALLGSMPSLTARRARLLTVGEILGAAYDARAAAPELARQGLVPWWPGWTPPSDALPATKPGGRPPSALVQAAPDHWVGVWATPAAAAIPARQPSLAARMARLDGAPLAEDRAPAAG